MSFSRPTTEKERDILRFVKFNRAASGDDVEGVEKFLKHNPQISSGVLSTAVSNKHFKVVDLLLSLSNFKITEKELNFSFGEAILIKNESLALRLLDRGSNPNEAVTILKETPLICAAQRGLHALIRRLIEKGAEPNTQDASIISEMLGKPLGKTALMHACEKCDEGTVALLISCGCDVNARGESGITALDIALRSKKRDSVAKLLRKAGGKTSKELDAMPAKTAKEKKQAVSVDELPPRLSLDDASDYLAEKFTLAPSAHPRAKGVVLLSNPNASGKTEKSEKRKESVDKVFNAFLKRGIHVFSTWDRDVPPCIALFAATDSTKIVTRLKTGNANFGVTNKSLVEFMCNLQRKNPFVVIGCGSAFVECRFEKPIRNGKDVAQRLFDFCPFVVSEHQEKVAKLARHLERVGTFCIWWD